MSFYVLFYTVLPIIFLIVVTVAIYLGKVQPNLKVGVPILTVGVALIAIGIVTANPPLSTIGFLIFIVSLVFMPRRRRW